MKLIIMFVCKHELWTSLFVLHELWKYLLKYMNYEKLNCLFAMHELWKYFFAINELWN